MPNPENILKKLKEYYEVKKKVSELIEREIGIERIIRSELKEELRKIIDEENVIKILAYELWHIIRKLDELDTKEIKKKLVSSIEEYDDECLEIDYGLTKGDILKYVSDEVCSIALRVREKYMDKIKEYHKLSKQCARLVKYRRSIFGIEDGDILSLDNLVRLVYKCVKYALEE